MDIKKTVDGIAANADSRPENGGAHSMPVPNGVLGVVLAASHSWGECALVNVAARPLWPVAGRPLVGHILQWLADGGVADTYICGNSETAAIRHRLDGEWRSDRALKYYEDVMPRGPAGCVRDVADRDHAEIFVVVEGTVLPQVDLAAVLRQHAERKADFTMVAATTQSLCVSGTHGSLTPVGIYVMSRAVAKSVPAAGFQDMKESLIPRLHVDGKRIAVHVIDGELAPRVTSPTTYLSINRFMMRRMAQTAKTLEGYTSFNNGWVHRTARVDPTVRFVGPVLVGPGSEIQAGAMIMGPTSIGGDCVIGREAVVSRSVLWNGCVVGEGAIVEHCVAADNTEVEEGVVMRNVVSVPSRRSRKGFFGRLAALRQATRSGNGDVRPAAVMKDGGSAAAERLGLGNEAFAPQSPRGG